MPENSGKSYPPPHIPNFEDKTEIKKRTPVTTEQNADWMTTFFTEEFSFPDLISSSGKPLRFDFAVFDDNDELDFLIEFQGI